MLHVCHYIFHMFNFYFYVYIIWTDKYYPLKHPWKLLQNRASQSSANTQPCPARLQLPQVAQNNAMHFRCKQRKYLIH